MNQLALLCIPGASLTAGEEGVGREVLEGSFDNTKKMQFFKLRSGKDPPAPPLHSRMALYS